MKKIGNEPPQGSDPFSFDYGTFKETYINLSRENKIKIQSLNARIYSHGRSIFLSKLDKSFRDKYSFKDYDNPFVTIGKIIQKCADDNKTYAKKILREFFKELAFGPNLKASAYDTVKIIERFQLIPPEVKNLTGRLTWEELEYLGLLSRQTIESSVQTYAQLALRAVAVIEQIRAAQTALRPPPAEQLPQALPVEHTELSAKFTDIVQIVAISEQSVAQLAERVQSEKTLEIAELVKIALKALSASQIAQAGARAGQAIQKTELVEVDKDETKKKADQALSELKAAQESQTERETEELEEEQTHSANPSLIRQEFINQNLINILCFYKKIDFIKILYINSKILKDFNYFINFDDEITSDNGATILEIYFKELIAIVKNKEIPFPVGRAGANLLHYINYKIKKENKEVKDWWNKEAYFDVRDIDGNTLLHSAAQYKDWETVQLLLDKGADPQIQDHQQQTLLHLAAKAGKEDIIQLLCERRMDFNARDSRGNTPLHQAARNNRWDTVWFLLDKGANPQIQNNKRQTLLHFAALVAKEDIIELLCEQKVDLNARDSEGNTPLDLAAYAQRWDTVRLLLDKGANPQIQNHQQPTLLHLAAADGGEDIVTLLCEKGMDLNARDSEGNTPLHFAAGYGREDIITLLLRAGADWSIRDKAGKVFYHHILLRETNPVRFLLEQGAHIDIEVKKGLPLLHLLVKQRNTELVKLALEKGEYKDINKKDSQGDTVLDIALFLNLEDIGLMLLNQKAQPTKLTDSVSVVRLSNWKLIQAKQAWEKKEKNNQGKKKFELRGGATKNNKV